VVTSSDSHVSLAAGDGACFTQCVLPAYPLDTRDPTIMRHLDRVLDFWHKAQLTGDHGREQTRCQPGRGTRLDRKQALRSRRRLVAAFLSCERVAERVGVPLDPVNNCIQPKVSTCPLGLDPLVTFYFFSLTVQVLFQVHFCTHAPPLSGGRSLGVRFPTSEYISSLPFCQAPCYTRDEPRTRRRR
jgi:hypothetical protein